MIISVVVFAAACKPDAAPPPPEAEVYTSRDTRAPAAAPELPYETGRRLLDCNFFDEMDFYNFTSQAESYNIEGKFISATVPHHLLAGDIIANTFKTAADARPDIASVVIIAPVHGPKSALPLTTLCDWASPGGVFQNDTGFSERFISNLNAAPDNEMLTSDHSAAALVPFAQYYFPGAACAVILVPQFIDIGFAYDLAALLSEFNDEKECFFVFSMDFSHYLSPIQTQLYDGQTREAVSNGGIFRIATMTDANVDSPKNLCAFIILNEILEANVQELDHSNSFEILQLAPGHPDFDEGLTSYFVFGGIK